MSLRLMILNALNQIMKVIQPEKRMEWLLQDGILTTSIGKGLENVQSTAVKIFMYEFEFPTAIIDRWTTAAKDRRVDQSLKEQETECSHDDSCRSCRKA